MIDIRDALGRRERWTARLFIDAVLRRVPAELVQASLFGSRARGEGRFDSDVDLLLVFAHLPPHREPQASIAERLAAGVARESGVPVTAWSVALADLRCGNRTPMLVDALEDAIPLWWRDQPLPRLTFSPPDALRCVAALLKRTDEGADEVAACLGRGDAEVAARRIRDDLVRVCVAGLLLRGITRPRRGAAVRAFVRILLRDRPPPHVLAVLRWAASSYGADGKDDVAPLRAPPGGLATAAAVVESFRPGIARGVERLADRMHSPLHSDATLGNGTCAHPGPAGSTSAPSLDSALV